MWLVVLAASLAAGAGLSDVMSLDPSSASLVDEAPFVLVAFTLAGCGHCAALKPTWQRLGAAFPNRVANVDCDAHRQTLCRDVHSFPTIRAYRAGKMTPYNGKRDLDSLSLLVDKLSGLPVRQASAEGEWISRDAAVVVATAQCSLDMLEAAAEATDRKYYFVQLTTPSDKCQVDVVRNKGAERATWTGGDVSLADFVIQEANPLVSPFDKFVHARSGRPVVYLFHEDEEPDEASLEAMTEAARRLRSTELMFCTVNKQVWDGKRMGIRHYPGVGLGVTNKLNVHYAYPYDEFSDQSLVTWLQSFLDGTLNRTRVSLPVPTSQGAVRQIVGDNFQAEVMDNEQDVLVYFRSDHCGSSKKFDPVWADLVDKLSGKASTLILATADGWSNDWPDWVNVVGLPDVRLFPGDAKESSKRFHGDRTVQNILKWFNTYALNPIEAHDEL